MTGGSSHPGTPSGDLPGIAEGIMPGMSADPPAAGSSMITYRNRVRGPVRDEITAEIRRVHGREVRQ